MTEDKMKVLLQVHADLSDAADCVEGANMGQFDEQLEDWQRTLTALEEAFKLPCRHDYGTYVETTTETTTEIERTAR